MTTPPADPKTGGAALREALRTVRDVSEWSRQNGDPLFDDETIATLDHWLSENTVGSLDVERLAAAMTDDDGSPPLWDILGPAGKDQARKRAAALAERYRRLAATAASDASASATKDAPRRGEPE